MTEACVALLGRRDEPTDAVEEYCTWLARGLAPLGINLELARVPWARTGWRAALADLRRHAPAWAGRVILVQYTALAWSERGFPTRFPGLLRVLRAAGARCVLVFHDAKPYTGARLIDRARRAWQTRVMRSAWALADGVVLTVPLERLTWQPPPSPVPVFLPVGANLPARSGAAVSERDAGAPLTVAVFGVTGGEHAPREVADIALAVNRAAARVSGLRLVVFGRGAEDARMLLETAIDRSRVALEVRGVLPEQGSRAPSKPQTRSYSFVTTFPRGGAAQLPGLPAGCRSWRMKGPRRRLPLRTRVCSWRLWGIEKRSPTPWNKC